MPVIIEEQQGPPPLPYYEKRVLETMFKAYSRLVVRKRLAGGLGGSSVYLVRPIWGNDDSELPSVAKIDRSERIEREWKAYSSYIQRRLPSVAEIRDGVVTPPSSQFSGLWYPLAGDDIDRIISLHQYFLETSPEKIARFLKNPLFNRLSTLWRQATPYPNFHFRTGYDDFLQLNLKIACTEAKGKTEWLHPESIYEREWEVGEFVQISGFKVVKLLHEKQGLSLDTLEEHKAFRFHVYGIGDISQYTIDQIIKRPFTGLIKDTRDSQLFQQAQNAIGPDMDLKATILTLPDGQTLANPLTNLKKVLRNSMDVKVSHIHGDLNMENIIVNMDMQAIHLIDFAKSRKDHVLRDLLHLEMTVVNKILSETVTSGETAATTIYDLYQRLHCAVVQDKQIAPPLGQEKVFTILQTIRQAARSLLYKSGNWQEYYCGLFIYLLGSLRYGDLDKLPLAPRPKQLAFWGAAAILDLMENEPKCAALIRSKWSSSQPEPERLAKNVQSVHDNSAKSSQLHLDTAIPRQVFVGRTSNITVAIRWPTSPKLSEHILRKGNFNNQSLTWVENELEEELEIHFVASNCEITSFQKYIFQLNQELPSQIFSFQITPNKVSRPDLIFSLYREGEWVGSAFAKTSAEEEVVGGVKTNIFTYVIDKTKQTNEQRIMLLNNLVSKLNKDELKNLCFELEVDHEDIIGENKPAKARELITYCERHGRLKELVQASHNKIPIGPLWSSLSRLN